MTDTTRCMVDIETTGLEPGSAIVSIGAVLFDHTGIGDRFTASISLSSCQDHGLTIDGETIQWWMQQDDAVQQQLAGGESLPVALRAFRDWYTNHEIDEIWANSPSFDCEMLEAAYSRIDVAEPWDYYQERDYRTLTNLPISVDVEPNEQEHDALADATHQARVASATLAKL